jgi:hypothetical protein
MNTIICLAVCVIALALFLAIPYIMVRRIVLQHETETLTLEVAMAAIFAILTGGIATIVFDLAQGYAALYVDSVGWWTL